jgi:dolichol-phosphate mannosyltransferase
MKKATIVLPTYNEAGTIEKLIKQIDMMALTEKNWALSVLVVDSSSPDKTALIVKKQRPKNIRLYLLETKKEGLGKAYTHGFEYAFAKINPYVIFEMDADLSHNPQDIPRFLRKIEQGADFVIGSRYIKGGSIPNNWGIDRKIFSICGNLIVRFGFMKPQITDWTNGFRAIKAWVVKSALNHIRHFSGYVFQIAFLDEALKKGAVIKETPINFIDRQYGASKISSLEYILNIFSYIFLHSSFIKFVIVGLTGAVIDFGLSYLFIEKFKFIIWQATLLSAEIAIMANFILNNFWSFKHKKITAGISNYLTAFLKFNLVSSGSLLIQSLGMQIATTVLGRKFWYLYKILIIAFIILPYSYFFYNKFIWKKK